MYSETKAISEFPHDQVGGEIAEEKRPVSLPKGCRDMAGKVFIALNIMLSHKLKLSHDPEPHTCSSNHKLQTL